ncbi:sialoadhesin-like [Hoplias malabaricus]|uniref:sialoadhesin-like n=1 Tax=Hoplias malabaricus TaxID=27720 RepID=UPI0034618738
MRALYRSVVVKRELSRKAKPLIYRSIYVPTLTYGHELWVVTERTRSWVQVAEMSFLRRVSGLSLRDRFRTSDIQERLGVEPLLLFVEMRVLTHNEWGVKYNPMSICALKASTVTMGCTYTYPSNHSVQEAFWDKQWPTNHVLLNDPEYRDRAQFTGDKQHNCTLRLRDVTEKDQSKYYFRFITDRPQGKWTGAGGVDLSVTVLQVEVPETVTEGDKVTLTCKTSCSLTDSPTFTWYENGHGLSSRTDQLHLQSVSREDKGRYHCAVQGLNSPEVTLNVRYGPKNILVSIRPSGDIVEDSSVTLTCSSDANPPPECNWFKGTSLAAKGEIYTMNRIRSVDSGEYKCNCSNEHGEKYSEALTLNVLYPPKSVSVSISPSGATVENSSVTLTCSSDANPPPKCNWFKGTTYLSKGENYTMNKTSSVDSGEYKCKCRNKHREKYSEVLTLNVLYPPKSVSVSITFSGETVEDRSVTLTCSSDANPPVQNYTWFKEGETSPVGSGHSYSFTKNSRSSGWWYCFTQNELGSKKSAAVTLNVRYGPKTVSVSISPSGEIVEDSSAILECSSDANPPVECSWFKGTLLETHSQTYTMNEISSLDSGEYKCKCRNELGEKYSEALTLNVLYPPKSVSVSIRPSGDIVEGSSVTLTCGSDANPPVQNYTWFKKLDNRPQLKSIKQKYSISNIRSADSGEYQCMVTNTQGSQFSEYNTLTVLYGPKSVSVSILPSGETVEDSSVTLTCSSDANPPPECNWFKGTSFLSNGENYTMNRIRSVDSGEYKCKCSNEHGEKYSEALTLKVLYPPKSVSVSITFSGVTIEDSSVTLTCSSDANPPVQNYTWFKEGNSFVAKRENHTMNRICSVNSGEYKCKCSNKHGEKYSEALTLNVLYGPKILSVSIAFFGETMGNNSVTLTCSSDANPPVQNYTWFKEGETSPVGSGHSYSFIKNSRSSGWYYCFTQNELGSKKSAAVTLNVRYGPKSVSASIRPSGEPLEDSSVTLTCSSDANPPPECNWFKGTLFLPKGENYTMNRIRSVDSGEYKCKCSNEHREKYSEAQTLNVLYLQVEVPERVTEGDKVTLTCKTSCSLTDSPTFTWYKNGHGLSSRTEQLHLQSVSRKDKDRYHCAAQGLNSPEITLNVRYGPKSVSVSIRPSGDILEDSSVTLTCSSDANPPPGCNWLKGKIVFKGETITMNRIRSVESGSYKCQCKNDYGVKYSKALTLNVLYHSLLLYGSLDPPKSVSVSIRPSGEIVEGSSVTLTCSSEANPPVQNYTWFKRLDKGPQLKSTQQNYSISNISSADSGEYRCMATNTRGSRLSEYNTLTVLYGPKILSVSITFFGETVGHNSVTLTCSSDANPPVQNYTWFKEENSLILYVVAGVGVCGVAVITAVAFMWRKKKSVKDSVVEDHDNIYQNYDPKADDNTFTALESMPRSSDNVYSSAATVHSSPSDDPYTALDPLSRSPEYDTLAVSQSSSTEVCLVAL